MDYNFQAPFKNKFESSKITFYSKCSTIQNAAGLLRVIKKNDSIFFINDSYQQVQDDFSE